jgi:hypothetical protein
MVIHVAVLSTNIVAPHAATAWLPALWVSNPLIMSVTPQTIA